MDPPRPPSPPLGPPRGTRISRRKAMQPLPPLPAWISMSTSSTNIRSRPGSRRPSGLVDGLDADHAAARPVIGELPAAHAQARLEAAATLTDQDRSAFYEVAVEPLDAEALRVAVASVAGTALTLFMCHDGTYALMLLTCTRVCSVRWPCVRR